VYSESCTCADCALIRSGREIDEVREPVLAFGPLRGEWFFVAEDYDELDGMEGAGLGGEQCDSCGSFGPEGEPVGYVIEHRENSRSAKAVCQGCGTTYQICTQPSDRVVF
jgi:hypothetical protein